jgi:hypothetical protein
MSHTGTHNNTEFASTSTALQTDQELQLTASALSTAARELTSMAFAGKGFTQDDLNAMMRAAELLQEMLTARHEA